MWIEDDNNQINIGEKTTIQPKTHLASIEGCEISIGKDCMLSSEIHIRTGDSHSILNANGKRINKSKNVIIGEHCWIGHRAMIMKGSQIPDNSIIGAGSIVTNQFNKKNTIIAGNPAKIIKEEVSWIRERI